MFIPNVCHKQTLHIIAAGIYPIFKKYIMHFCFSIDIAGMTVTV